MLFAQKAKLRLTSTLAAAEGVGWWGKVGRGEVSFFTILCRLHLDDARPDDMSIISSLWIARSRVVSQDLEDTVCSAMGYTSRVSSHS